MMCIYLFVGCVESQSSLPKIHEVAVVNNFEPILKDDPDVTNHTCDESELEKDKFILADIDEAVEFAFNIKNAENFKYIYDSEGTYTPTLSKNMTQMSWYITYCDRHSFKKIKKGIFFEAENGDLHTGKSVYVNAGQFYKLDRTERAKSLLHNLVMSFYIIKYLPAEGLYYHPKDPEKYIYTGPSIPPEDFKGMTDSDFKNINEVTEWLFSKTSDVYIASAEAEYETHGFDKRWKIFRDLSYVWKQRRSE